MVRVPARVARAPVIGEGDLGLSRSGRRADEGDARNLLMRFIMSFSPAFMLYVCRSVEIVSGRNPAFVNGTATRQKKLPAPYSCAKAELAIASTRVRKRTGRMTGLQSESDEDFRAELHLAHV